MIFMALWLFCIAGIIFVFVAVGKKVPLGTFLAIACIITGFILQRPPIAIYGGSGGFLLGLVVQLFSKDPSKRGKTIDIFIGTIVWAVLILYLWYENIIYIKDDESRFVVIGALTFSLGIICNIPFRRVVPVLTDRNERISVSDIKNITFDDIFKFLDHHTIFRAFLCIGLALGTTTLILGVEAADDAGRSIFSGQNFLFKFLFIAFIAIYRLLLLYPLDKCWKVHYDWWMGVLTLITGYLTYALVSDHYYLHPATPDNIPMQIYTQINSGAKWIGSFLPDWFYADGWLNLWCFIRSAIAGIISILSPALLIILPFYFIYEFWHKKEDMRNSLYELTVVILLFPIYIATTTWILKSVDTNNPASIHAIFTIVYAVIFFKAAVLRKRCPVCGCSNLSKFNEYVYKHAEKKDSVERTANGKDQEEKVRYSQQIDTHYDVECNRCKYQWHEVRYKIEYRTTRKNKFDPQHDPLFRNSDDLLKGD